MPGLDGPAHLRGAAGCCPNFAGRHGRQAGAQVPEPRERRLGVVGACDARGLPRDDAPRHAAAVRHRRDAGVAPGHELIEVLGRAALCVDVDRARARIAVRGAALRPLEKLGPREDAGARVHERRVDHDALRAPVGRLAAADVLELGGVGAGRLPGDAVALLRADVAAIVELRRAMRGQCRRSALGAGGSRLRGRVPTQKHACPPPPEILRGSLEAASGSAHQFG